MIKLVCKCRFYVFDNIRLCIDEGRCFGVVI